jgi:hypothetical protein
MVKMCPKCKLRFSDDTRSCSKCYGELVDKKTLMTNARITVTITKSVYATLAQEAQNQSMVLSEYAASLLRQRAMTLSIVPSDAGQKKKV